MSSDFPWNEAGDEVGGLTYTGREVDGKPRLNITVDADGNPRIEFLDAEGKVVAKLPR